MTPSQVRKFARGLREYIDSMVADMGRLERRRAMEQHLTGLLLDGARKSVEPIKGRLVANEHEREAMRQRVQQCVAMADWSDAQIRRRQVVKPEKDLPELAAFVVDDTGSPTKGNALGGGGAPGLMRSRVAAL
jgi:SRSO17 transposase